MGASQLPQAVAQITTVGSLGRAIVTASQGSITTEVDLTGLVVTVTVAANRLIQITGYVQFKSTVVDDVAGLVIKESTTQLGAALKEMRPANIGSQLVAHALVVAPSAGSHTYKLTGQRVAGTGTLTAEAGATFPAFILVEDLGPS